MKTKLKSKKTAEPKTYKIEKGVKLPPPGKAVASVQIGPTTATLAKLEKGESFLVKDALEALRAAKTMRDCQARERESKTGREYASRKIGDGVRIWRVK